MYVRDYCNESDCSLRLTGLDETLMKILGSDESGRVSLKELRTKAMQNGMVTLQADGIEKVKAGIISIEGVLRTTQTADELL
jgi:type II secretory ATPase GspE/PulE/Tfp pilus assembly ATPase PilB-like protein